MKAVLEFTMPEEEYDFKTAVNAIEWKDVVEEVDDMLRTELKYSDLGEGERAKLQKVRDYLRNALIDRGLSIA